MSDKLIGSQIVGGGAGVGGAGGMGDIEVDDP